LTQAELARAVGYSREQITHLESGTRTPDPITVAALFIPALDLQEEPELAARLLNLAEAVQSDSSGSAAETEATAQAPQNQVAEAREDARVAHRAAAEVAELAQGDLVEAARQYFLAGDFKAAADVVWDQGQLLSNQGRALEAVDVLDQILATVSELPKIRDRADIMRRLLTTRGDLLLNTVRAEEAEANFREALALASGAIRTTLTQRLAVSLTQRGRAAEALAMIREAYKDLPDQHLLIRAQLKIVESGALMALSRLEEAEPTNLEALALCDQLALAMPFIVAGIRARANNSLGTINAIRHHRTEALAHWKYAVDTARLAGLRSLEYRCQGNIANLLYEMGDLTSAMTACELAIEGLQSINDLHGMARFMHLRANLLYTRGNVAASLEMAREACQVKDQLGDRHSLLVSRNQEVKSLFALGRVREAMPLIDHAFAELDTLGDDRLRGYWLMLWTELHMFSGEPSRARDSAREAMALPIMLDDVKLQSDCCNHLALALLAEGQLDTAFHTLLPEATGIPEIDLEHDLIAALLDLARGDREAMAANVNAIANRAHEGGYLIFELRARHILHASSNSLPYSEMPALVYGKVIA
jgi:tetratricopeptide (TPR) repeat protein